MVFALGEGKEDWNITFVYLLEPKEGRGSRQDVGAGVEGEKGGGPRRNLAS